MEKDLKIGFGIIFLIAGICIFFIFDGPSAISDYFKNRSDEKNIDKIEKLIHEEKYSEAYNVAYELHYSISYNTLKIVKNEIANLVSTSEGNSNYAKIIFVINDKGHFFDRDRANTSGAYEYAIEMAEAVDNQELANKLKEKLKKLENKDNDKNKKGKK